MAGIPWVRTERPEHGYVASEVPGEDFYRFANGWSAYLLYKMLDNGQALRLFIDQSDAGHPTQIIQHWNRLYGYTAHHLAIRATRPPLSNVGQLGARVAATLEELCDALAERGIGVMEATGHYTEGLLLEVFARPGRTPRIPRVITEGLARLGAGLETKIQNGKLLELARRGPRRTARCVTASPSTRPSSTSCSRIGRITDSHGEAARKGAAQRRYA